MLDQDLTLNLAKHARKLGVRFKDRVEIVDLLKDGERVCGAIGFGMVDGECVIVQAGAVVLANGNQCFKLMPRWSSAGGEGIAAAWRAGAVMRNAEFGNFINWVFADTKEVCQGAEDCLYNARGENISKRVRPTLESDVHSKEVVEWWREMKAGNGPICANMAENYVNNEIVPGLPRGQARRAAGLDEVLGPHHRQGHGRLEGQGPDAAGHARPQRRAVAGQGRPPDGDHRAGPLRHRRHRVRRLVHRRRRAGAARPHARLGLGFAVFSAVQCAPAAVAAARAGAGAPDAAQAEALKARIMAPLGRSGMAPVEMVHAVQDVMVPVGYSIYKSADRMTEALDKVLALKEQVPELAADDPHHLAACHVAEAMVLGAELFYRASLAREETRGWHIREDFPERDDAQLPQVDRDRPGRRRHGRVAARRARRHLPAAALTMPVTQQRSVGRGARAEARRTVTGSPAPAHDRRRSGLTVGATRRRDVIERALYLFTCACPEVDVRTCT